MNRIFILFFFLTPCVAYSALSRPLTPEFRVSYFLFNDGTVKEIYSNGTINYQLGLSYPLVTDLSLWGSVSFLTCDGHSIGEEDPTSLYVLPFNLGFRYAAFSILQATVFVEGGASFFRVGVQNENPFVLQYASLSGWGGFIGTGIAFHATTRLIFDLFAEHAFRRTHPRHHKEGTTSFDIDVGGWDFGGGIAYKF